MLEYAAFALRKLPITAPPGKKGPDPPETQMRKSESLTTILNGKQKTKQRGQTMLNHAILYLGLACAVGMLACLIPFERLPQRLAARPCARPLAALWLSVLASALIAAATSLELGLGGIKLFAPFAPVAIGLYATIRVVKSGRWKAITVSAWTTSIFLLGILGALCAFCDVWTVVLKGELHGPTISRTLICEDEVAWAHSQVWLTLIGFPPGLNYTDGYTFDPYCDYCLTGAADAFGTPGVIICLVALVVLIVALMLMWRKNGYALPLVTALGVGFSTVAPLLGQTVLSPIGWVALPFLSCAPYTNFVVIALVAACLIQDWRQAPARLFDAGECDAAEDGLQVSSYGE